MKAKLTLKNNIIRKINIEGHCEGYERRTNKKLCFAVSAFTSTICALDSEGVSVCEYGHFVYEPTTPKYFAYIECLVTLLSVIASNYPLAIEFVITEDKTHENNYNN